MSETSLPVPGFFERIALNMDFSRAVRTALAFAIPLVIFHAMHRPADAMFVAFTGQIIALQDLRGAYAIRITILAAMMFIAAGAVALGVSASGSVIACVLGMGLVAVLNGLWRHLSSDYGPPMAVSSALLFLLGIAQHGTFEQAVHLAGLVLLGGLCASILHIGFWIFHPQHPLRHAVAETWVAASDLVGKIRVADEVSGNPDAGFAEEIAACERDLRAALDRTFLILGAAENKRQSSLFIHLEEMRREVVHFSMRVIAFHASMEPLRGHPGFVKNLPIIDSVLKALGDAARSVAITLITHRPENFAATEIRMQRCGDLIRVLDRELAFIAGDIAIMQVRATLHRISESLPVITGKLRETVDHASARSTFPQMLPELGTRSVQSLAAWINPAPRLDPVLVRYSMRMALVTMVAVALYKGYQIPHGYWMAFTIIVVLQPDYGSTRQRAGQRICGTLAGILLGSGLVWIRMPLVLLDASSIVTSFCFAYFVKRRYGIGIFFVTLLIVLTSETMNPLDLKFTGARLLCTLFGGGMALTASLFFWPVWENRKFPALLAAALRANGTFLETMGPLFGLPLAGGGVPDILMSRRRAENANRYAAESLKRMTAEPGGGSDAATRRAAILATYSQRITRAFTAVAVHAGENVTLNPNSNIPGLVLEIEDALENLAVCIERKSSPSAIAGIVAALEKIDARLVLVQITPPKETPDALSKTALIWTQLAKCIAEIRAMALALDLPQALEKRAA